MVERFRNYLLIALILLLSTGSALAQTSTSGTMLGTVTDPTGAVIAGADVKIKDDATGAIRETKSGPDGTFSLANVSPGTYTVTVTMSGFKTSEIRNVKVIVGTPANVVAKLNVGEVSSSVVVEAGAEVLQTQQTTVGSTVTGKLITTIPFTSRETLDLAVLDPGAQTLGAPRGTTFNGLPQGAINITLDGLNAQVNDAKSSDGFFTMIRARIDAVEEFSISTAGQGAEQSAEGAVQIRFETKRGGNEFHGGAWWYHRNDFLNANYYFSNLNGTPRQRLRLNQYGYNVGGPIWKDKVFFFHSFDFYKKPESLVQNRTILTPDATAGRFTYQYSTTGAAPPAAPAWSAGTPGSFTCNQAAGTCTASLLAMAGFNSIANNSLDPTIQTWLNAINTMVGQPGVGQAAVSGLHLRGISFNNSASGERWFPDFRFDYQMTKNHSFTATYHYGDFNSTPDLLNGRGPRYLVAPFDTYISSQLSTRNAITVAWRWNIGSMMSNEARFGVQSVPSNFRGDQLHTFYPQFNTAVGSLYLRPSVGTISQPFHDFSPFTRNYAIAQLFDNFGWAKGKHNLSFGFSMTELRGGFENRDALAGQVNIGLGTSNVDPATAIFSTANLPGTGATDRTNARNLYGLLAGRVTSISSSFIYVDNETRQFTLGSSRIDRIRQTEFGIYAADNWRWTNTLTVNYGLRWEYQGPGEDPDNLFYRVVGDRAGLFGISGEDNLFMPGTLTGSRSTYELNGSNSWHNKDLNNLAPSLGLAWQPSWENKLWKSLFGEPGKTVFRLGYAVTYTREGANNWIQIANNNPGSRSDLAAAAQVASLVNPAIGQFAGGTVQFSSLNIPNVVAFPLAFGGSLTADPNRTPLQSVNAFAPDLQIPAVQSWTAGIQRELTPNLVLELRYVGNHGTGLWRRNNLNEINIFENGFLNEFLQAQRNLAICQAGGTAATNPCIVAQAAAGVPAASRTSNHYGNWAITNAAGTQVPLPIITGSLTGALNTGVPGAGSCNVSATALASIANQCNTGFAGGNVSFLTEGQAGAFANAVMNTLAGWTNLTGGTTGTPLTNPATGQPFPVNFWMVNPHARGGASILTNGSHSTYNALQVELRQRTSKGLQFNGSYTFSKSLTNLFADSSTNTLQFVTMRNAGLNKGPSPFDLRHAFKLQLIYEFPFGPGRKWSSSQGWFNRVIEGWDLSTITRWQSGRVFQVTSGDLLGNAIGGTVNQYDSGVQLTGITPNQLQSMLEVRKVPGNPGRVFYFPASLLNANGSVNQSFISTCRTPGQFCNRLFLYGPDFFRADWSIIKKTRITEKVNFEFRAEFLNAFNNINFFVGGSAGASIAAKEINGSIANGTVANDFGRIFHAYQDVSTTDDPGGRIIQIVLRINF